MTAYLLNKWLNRNKCQEVRLMYAFNKLTLAIMRIDHSEKI